MVVLFNSIEKNAPACCCLLQTAQLKLDLFYAISTLTHSIQPKFYSFLLQFTKFMLILFVNTKFLLLVHYYVLLN